MRRGWQELALTHWLLYVLYVLYMDMRAQSHHHNFVVNSTVLLALFLLQSSWNTCVDCKSIIPKYYSRNCTGSTTFLSVI